MATAFVFSAGGLYAAWEVGVWKVLRERIQPDLVVGASAGAWNAWAIAGGATPAELAAEWLDPLTAGLLQPGLHRAGILKPDALHRKARELFARFQPRMRFGLTVVEVPQLRTRLVSDGQVRWSHLAATSSIPLCFPPVRIAGRNYVDGGLFGALPLWAAEEMGAHRAIGINCLTALPFRLLRTVMPPRRPGPRFDVTVIEPSRPLGSLREAMVWTQANIERWIALGEEDGKRAVISITM